jgi:D-amino peptidase
MQSLGRTFLFAAACCIAPAQEKKTIFIITDAEGVSGVCSQAHTKSTDPEMRKLLAAEVNAAVQGFFEGGADEVIVWDGHAAGDNISVLDLHPRAKLLKNAMRVMTLERHYTALAFVGQHSKANTEHGNLAHTYTFGINVLLNGKAIGEIEATAALAGAYDTPVILLAGDQAAAAELREIVPEAETAVVKEGLTRDVCISTSPEAAQQLIRTAAARAMRKIGQIRPYKVAGEATITIEYNKPVTPPDGAAIRAGVELVDDHTIRFQGADFLEAWRRSGL